VLFVEHEVLAELMERGVGTLDHDRQLVVVARAVNRPDSWVRGMLEIMRATVFAERGGTEAALGDLARIAERYSDYPYVLAGLAYAKEVFETGWKDAAVRHGTRLAALSIQGER
jgi:hypothetical protein